MALAGLALAAPLAAAPAHAGVVGPSGSTVEARGLLSPLSMDVGKRGTVWFSQNFAGQLMRKPEGKKVKTAWAHPKGAEVGAVSAAGRGTTFATTGNKGRTTLRVLRDGEVRILANLSRYESRHNPDAGQTYGIVGLEEGCTVPRAMRPYEGIVESHPYATGYSQGTRYVADAAANAIFAVRGDGVVSTVAVLPPQDYEITAEAAEANGLPECAVGKTFAFEPVPTDVERGPDGMLYVSTLPGGPEDPSLGARGAVHRVDPETGDVETLATGLLSATGLAVGPAGDIFVAELFANRITRIPPGASSGQPWTNAQMPADVEFVDGSVWATRKALTGMGGGGRPAGQVVRYEGGVVTTS
jgi:sugar lactone lactonase YvrE